MQAKAKLQVLDEPVQPVDATGQTAQTGLTGHETSLNHPDYWKYQLGYKSWFITKAEDQDWRVHMMSYLKILVVMQKGIFGG